jgi:hypothetical protein
MLRNRSSQTLLTTVVAILTAVGCQGGDFSQTNAILKIKDGTPTESPGRYLVDFGAVPVGQTKSATVTVLDAGRQSLSLHKASVTPPFSTDLSADLPIAAGASHDVSFTFAPTQLGPFELVVTLTSNGGSATVVLRGSGVPGQCMFVVSPMQLDFGMVVQGHSKALAVQVADVGDNDCTVSDIRIDPASDPAFALASGQATSTTLSSTGGSFPVAVAFSPTTVATGLQGTLDLTMQPGATTVTIPLTGTGLLAPCAYSIQPTSAFFASVSPGTMATQTLQITATSNVACDISAVALASSTASTFTLAAGQPVSGTATPGSPFSIQIVFAPVSSGVESRGDLQLHIGPPDTPVDVVLDGNGTPCTFQVQPTPFSFSVLQVGQSATQTVQIVATGTVPCTVSGVQLASGSDASFALAPGQPTSGTATPATPFSIGVVFSPLTSAFGIMGQIDLMVGPPAAPASIPIIGNANPDPCGVRNRMIIVSCPGTSMTSCGACTSGATPQTFDLTSIPSSVTQNGGTFQDMNGNTYSFNSTTCTLTTIMYGPSTIGTQCMIAPTEVATLMGSTGTETESIVCPQDCTVCGTETCQVSLQ